MSALYLRLVKQRDFSFKLILCKDLARLREVFHGCCLLREIEEVVVVPALDLALLLLDVVLGDPKLALLSSTLEVSLPNALTDNRIYLKALLPGLLEYRLSALWELYKIENSERLPCRGTNSEGGTFSSSRSSGSLNTLNPEPRGC